MVGKKGASDDATSLLTALIISLGFTGILVKSDHESSLLSLLDRVSSDLPGVEVAPMTSPEGEHAWLCRGRSP